MMRTYKLEQMQFRFAAGAGKLEDHTPVFTEANGKALTPSVTKRALLRRAPFLVSRAATARSNRQRKEQLKYQSREIA
jgi:hypothetical protein